MSRGLAFAALVLPSCRYVPEGWTTREVPLNIHNPADPHGEIADQALTLGADADLVVFVDDGPTSADEQTKLGGAWPQWVDEFVEQGVAARVGLLRSDGTVELLGEEEDPTLSFAVGTDGPDLSQGLAAFRTAAESGALAASGLLRAQAELHTLIVTDRDAPPDPDFAEWYQAAFPGATFSVIGGASAEYEALSATIGGVQLDAGSSSWDAYGVALADQAMRPTEVLLSHLPNLSTVTITVELVSGDSFDATDLPWSHSVSRNSVTLDGYSPPALSWVRVAYEPAAGP